MLYTNMQRIDKPFKEKPLKFVSENRERVQFLSWSPDGKLIAAGLSKVICFWSLEEPSNKQTLEIGTLDNFVEINSLAWSPDGELIAVALNENIICIWNIKTFNLIRKFETDAKKIQSIAWSSDGLLVNAALLVYKDRGPFLVFQAFSVSSEACEVAYEENLGTSWTAIAVTSP